MGSLEGERGREGAVRGVRGVHMVRNRCNCRGSLEGGRGEGQLEELGVFTWSETLAVVGGREGREGAVRGVRGVHMVRNRCNCRGSLEGGRGEGQLEGLGVRNTCSCRGEGGEGGGS